MNRKHILLTLIILLLAVTALVQTASAQTYVTYVTQEGDSLSKIAAEYCTTWQAIYQINQQVIGLDPNIIIPGTVLTIPAYCTPSTTPPPTPPPSGVYDRGPMPRATGYVIAPNTYIVNWGDTMTGISMRFGVDANSIAQASGISDPDYIYYGQALTIPGLNGGYPPQGYQPPTYYPPQPTPPPYYGPDSDSDGWPDSIDQCPYEYGSESQYNGCPVPDDRDADGVLDVNDVCPDQWGYPQYSGCPNPPAGESPNSDRDGDGVLDMQDMCPDAVGLPEYHGCPSDV